MSQKLGTVNRSSRDVIVVQKPRPKLVPSHKIAVQPGDISEPMVKGDDGMEGALNPADGTFRCFAFQPRKPGRFDVI